MDERHFIFLQRYGVDTYNNYFNRDKKRTVVEPALFMANGIPAPQRIKSSTPMLESYRYDPFLYEYRDGDHAVPRPPENDKIEGEPDPSHYKNVPLEYIREHGVLEFILESGYPYCLESLFMYRKPSEYQMDYLQKLIREGRLTKKVFRI